MALTSLTYLVFLGIVCVVNYITPPRVRYIWLLAASGLFFVVFTGATARQALPSAALLLGVAALSWGCALGIGALQQVWLRRLLLCLCVAGCVGVFVACKYFGLFADIGQVQAPFSVMQYVLPLGVSYYTLRAAGYCVDVYVRRVEAEKNPLRYALFVGFFPGMVAGPIGRAAELLPQYRDPALLNYQNISGGLFRVVWGIFKKLVIVNHLAAYTAPLFESPTLSATPGLQLLLLTAMFAYQIYADFSSLFDICIGSARMLGFTLPENSRRPFAAKTFAEFWQRCHASLTSWLWDYVGKPLRGLVKKDSTAKKLVTAGAVLLCALLFGLWHGTAAGFLLFAAASGVVVALGVLIKEKKERIVARIPVYRTRVVRGIVQRCIVIMGAFAAFVFFAGALCGFTAVQWVTALLQPLAQPFSLVEMMAGGFGTTYGTLLPGQLWLALPAAILLVEVVESFAVTAQSEIIGWMRRQHFFVRWPIYYLVLGGIILFGLLQNEPFLFRYF